MKNFFTAVKESLNNIFPDANLTEETTESEVVDLLEKKEGTIMGEVEAVKKDQEVLTNQAVETEGAMLQLVESIKMLTEGQKESMAKIENLQGTVNSLKASRNNLPTDLSGDPAPVTRVEGSETEFKIGSRSGDVLKEVKTLLGRK